MQYRNAVAIGILSLFGQSASADTVVVRVFDFDFEALVGPADPTITIGDTVRWVWDGGFHSSTAALGQTEFWDSAFTSDTSYVFEHTFTNVGSFDYYCIAHGFDNGDGTAGGMAGTIHVVPAPGAAAIVVPAIGLGLMRRRR